MKKNIPSLPNPIKTKKSENAGDSIDGDIPSPEEGETKQPGINFPIIGIGASAGGLEALELFLKNVPLGSNMAFIVIQHQDPKHIGVMVELLQHSTPMRVMQVKDNTKLNPNMVYLIPPNKDMTIHHGVLHLFDITAPRGLHLPIDFFFRSLADDQQDRSVGVILSGMGSDGTLGLRAIKEKAGAVFVQSPESAKFNGMPRSAIDAGLADVISPADELPGLIADYYKHRPTHPPLETTFLEGKTQSALEKVIILIRLQTGHDFSQYKKSTISRRIERRMGIHHIDKIANYVRFLQENPAETSLLFKELMIGVTNFFRDPAAWEVLKNDIIPSLGEAHPAGGILRAWVPGCSTGEEAYSLAIVFKEAFETFKKSANYSLQIFATDLDRDAIDAARQGLYPANIVADVSPERIRRYFIKEEEGFRVSKEIREMIVFAPQNLIMDPPFTKLEILICRNLMIYLTGDLQKKLLPLFHYSLNPGGVLFLGSAETIGNSTNLFTPLDNKLRLFRRLESIQVAGQPADLHETVFPALTSVIESERLPPLPQVPPPNLQMLVDQLIIQNYSPASVLVDDKGDILYISGRTGKYLEPAAGKANWNIFPMAREGIRQTLNTAFHKATREKTRVIYNNVTVGTNGGTQLLDIIVYPLEAPIALQGMVLIVFKDVAPPAIDSSTAKGKRGGVKTDGVLQLEQDLQRSHEELQITREEMQTTQEELKSSNEELQSTNEELQSTNEELTTSKEGCSP